MYMHFLMHIHIANICIHFHKLEIIPNRKEFYCMSIDVNTSINAILIWLTNDEQNNPMVQQLVTMIETNYSGSKTKVVLMNSGKGNLLESTKQLLAQNKNLKCK